MCKNLAGKNEGGGVNSSEIITPTLHFLSTIEAQRAEE